MFDPASVAASGEAHVSELKVNEDEGLVVDKQNCGEVNASVAEPFNVEVVAATLDAADVVTVGSVRKVVTVPKYEVPPSLPVIW